MALYFIKDRLLIGIIIFCFDAWAADFKIGIDHRDGVYSPGEMVTWSIETVDLKKGEPAPAAVKYRLLSNSFEILREGMLELKEGRAGFSATRKNFGTLQLILEAPSIKTAASGAVFDPQSFKPALPCPDGFDAFWTEKIKEAEAVPRNPILTLEESPVSNVALWQITLDNIRGTKVRGQLARPKEGEKFPAMLIVQWAGFYPLVKQWVVKPASEGWLVLNTLAHDMPVYEPRSFYQELENTKFKDFYKIGNEDRNTSYYLGMYLSTVQAVLYLKSRPDWDGKTFVVCGGSQGGMLALVAAALNADTVTGVTAKVPGGCDLNGELAGNKSALPDWWNSALERPDPQKVRHAAEYYDVVNFSPKIKCPVLIGIALGDTICPPPGMFIAGNQIKTPTEYFIMPSAGHKSTPINPHKPYDNKEAEWLNELKAGKVPAKARQ